MAKRQGFSLWHLYDVAFNGYSAAHPQTTERACVRVRACVEMCVFSEKCMTWYTAPLWTIKCFKITSTSKPCLHVSFKSTLVCV